MERKKIMTQVVAAFILYVVISLILEKDYSQEIILREMTEGIVFGVVYGLFIWISSRWRKSKGDE